MAWGHPHFPGVPWSFHRTKYRVPAGRLRSPSSAPPAGPAALAYAERQIPAGEPGPSLADISPSRAGHAGSLPWPAVGSGSRGLAPGAVALTRPGIVLPVLRSFQAAQRMNAPAAATGIVP